ncbi:TPA: hypothetical protein MXR76_003998 [Pseudomonas aeruginosa]|uniref:hypothetical protein n=1 Tax=Pseudomonas aeruginosa TaxID=287 RepID=UPI00287E792D|nr:hypothetical protein [Pseudomonas aeruginosa]EKF7416857.1 hypothetical protein [Pseudomonas aeruginosa]MDS9918440.1 hypothetical protein [Pseudomonas aeruginosa]HCA5866489.1 hypothetical protein [Pseudomonas aeruginosa]HCA7376606.1 hypothetical protein [Pseudomonas aeruginosa]HCA7774840.1 hypothetical protein [Pseudomonas aeruginosa]
MRDLSNASYLGRIASYTQNSYPFAKLIAANRDHSKMASWVSNQAAGIAHTVIGPDCLLGNHNNFLCGLHGVVHSEPGIRYREASHGLPKEQDQASVNPGAPMMQRHELSDLSRFSDKTGRPLAGVLAVASVLPAALCRVIVLGVHVQSSKLEAVLIDIDSVM